MSKRKKCTWNGIRYESVAEAARANDVTYAAMTARIRNGYTCDDDLRNPGKQIDDETIEQVVKLHEDGFNREEISEILSISQPTIRKILALNGFGADIRSGDYGKPPATEKEKRRVIELYNSGYTAKQAAELTGYKKRFALDVIAEYAGEVENSRTKIAPELFIKMWQEADNLDQVAARFDITRANVLSKGWRFMQMGVPLKRLRSQVGYNWDELAELAAILLDEDAE